MTKKRNFLIFFEITLYIVIGFLLGASLDKIPGASQIMDKGFLGIMILLLMLYGSIFLQVIIHELGHLIFGLLTGYRFLSFRIANVMIIKKNNKLSFCNLSIVGTGGQCLMSPPEMKNGKLKNFLYNLGGVILNLIVSIIGFILISIISNPYINLFLVTFILVGLYVIITNGIPIGSIINNDGYNAYLLHKNKDAQRAFWLQMKINEQITLEKSLVDMPDEWFEVSSSISNNPMINTINVFRANRLMAQMNFKDAYFEMDKLLEENYNIVEIHQYLLILDCIYCELVDNKKTKYLEKYKDKNLQRFILSMKNFPSVLRVNYAYALLKENNLHKANEIKNKFEKMALSYPYAKDIDVERELIEYAHNIYEANN